MARYCKPFVVSVVLGYDIVPRLSIPTLNDFKWRLLAALQTCRVPKYRLLSRAAQIIGLNCLLPNCCREGGCVGDDHLTIGMDHRLFDEQCRANLINPAAVFGNPSTTESAPMEAAYESGSVTGES